jgi:hypothetical protein
MKNLLAIALLVMPSLAIGQDCRGVADCFQKSMRDQERYEQEKEMRRLQIERMRAGQSADPEIDRQLRDADSRRAAEQCRTEVYTINDERMTCKVCPGQQITMTNCTR